MLYDKKFQKNDELYEETQRSREEILLKIRRKIFLPVSCRIVWSYTLKYARIYLMSKKKKIEEKNTSEHREWDGERGTTKKIKKSTRILDATYNYKSSYSSIATLPHDLFAIRFSVSFFFLFAFVARKATTVSRNRKDFTVNYRRRAFHKLLRRKFKCQLLSFEM